MPTLAAFPEATEEFRVVNSVVANYSDEKLLAAYSDLMYTSAGESASPDERHGLLTEIQRRKLRAQFVETPQALRDKHFQKRLEANYSNTQSAVKMESVKGILERIFRRKSQ